MIKDNDVKEKASNRIYYIWLNVKDVISGLIYSDILAKKANYVTTDFINGQA